MHFKGVSVTYVKILCYLRPCMGQAARKRFAGMHGAKGEPLVRRVAHGRRHHAHQRTKPGTGQAEALAHA